MIRYPYILGAYYDCLKTCVSYPFHYCELNGFVFKEPKTAMKCCLDRGVICNAVLAGFSDEIARVLGNNIPGRDECRSLCYRGYYKYREKYIEDFNTDSDDFVDNIVFQPGSRNWHVEAIDFKLVVCTLVACLMSPGFCRLKSVEERIDVLQSIVVLFCRGENREIQERLNQEELRSACKNWKEHEVVAGDDIYSVVLGEAIDIVKEYRSSKTACSNDNVDHQLLEVINKNHNELFDSVRPCITSR